MTTYLTTPQGRHIAYHQLPGKEPGLVFLGGFRSDMTGSKAMHLQAWAAESGRAFLRFDYSGHGQSLGAFEDGAISDWREDAAAVIETLTEGPQVLVGSSMGGWIALLLARDMPERVAGLVGIAAAPDFTETMWEHEFTLAERTRLLEEGLVLRPSDYSDEPYPITRRLIEDGKQNLVLNRPLLLPAPVRLLQGTADTDVPQAVALHLLDHISSPDLQLTLVQGADHRFSSLSCLTLLSRTVEDLLAEVSRTAAAQHQDLQKSNVR
ncbi:MAG: alpha/beta hydrolase [Rhodobacterales bacterium]|nr:alpha/beta hydrolase [Rhodobacterales bacterium]